MSRMSISARAALAAAILVSAALPLHAAAQPAATTHPQATPRAGVASHAPAEDAAVANPFGPLELDSDQQRTLYALGLALSQSLSRLDLQGSELAYLVQGLQDGAMH